MLGFSLSLPTLLTLVSVVFGPKRSNAAKALPFESGMLSSGFEKHQMNIKFYLVAMVFLVFDIEVIFFYPWATVFRENTLYYLVAILPFLFFLILGLAYDWKKGALDWE